MKIVSVIVPIYKGNRYIQDLIYMLEENWKFANAVDSMEIELVIINDFPTEKMIVDQQWIKNISCVQIVNKRNHGIHFSRVHGFQHSKGDYIVFLDQDDVISPLYLREQLKKLKKYDMLICNGKNQSNLIYRSDEELKRAVDGEQYKNGCNWIVSPGQVLLRRKAVPEEWIHNIMKQNGADDYFLWRLMFHKKCKIGIHNEILYWHVISESNASNNLTKMYISIFEMVDIMKKLGYLTLKEEKEIKRRRNSANVEDEKYIKEKKYKSILDVWMDLRDRKISLEKFFSQKHLYKIIIYGGGILGKHLYCELLNSKIYVECFMDQKGYVDFENVKTIIPGESIESIDAIVVTPIMEYRQISSYLKDIYACAIISIESILLNADCTLMVE